MESLSKNCEKLAKGQKNVQNKTLQDFKKLSQLLTTISDKVKSLGDQATCENSDVSDKIAEIKKVQAKLVDSHKDFYTNIAKYNKLIEKTFKTDLIGISDSNALEGKENIINCVIVDHFIRNSDFELAQLFCKETGISLPEEPMSRFTEMHRLVKEIRQRKLTGALEWANKHRNELNVRGITLEFMLHKQRYLQLIEDGKTKEALSYAKQNFQEYITNGQGPKTQQSSADDMISEFMNFDAQGGYLLENSAADSKCNISSTGGSKETSAQASPLIDTILSLMGVLVYANRLQDSPYKDMFSPQQWENVAHAFSSAFCTLLGLASESPLATSIMAGSLSLPIIIKMSQLLTTNKMEWSQKEELPVEVPLPENLRFHSVFVCPVSKDRATPKNPPMMLPCGHVICKESLEKLAKGLRSNMPSLGRFKCPYCPSLSTMNEAKPVYF
ncbi:hypothetical protein H4219_002726 [Mycoemilia scoparia]|uniref:GID complex catalytic subunit 2 n=1 Tax=Mycoemilia scoparia TaxID=417184 RepID=A0A9W8DU05_9FUNG|nr:hypothetical protein H4219_002726 [Mycoemilia scoparia]